MTGDCWKKANVAKRLNLGLGICLSLYSMRNIFLKAFVFRRKKSLSTKGGLDHSKTNNKTECRSKPKAQDPRKGLCTHSTGC